MDRESFHKKLISSLRAAMYDFSESEVLKHLDKLFQQECWCVFATLWERLLELKIFILRYINLFICTA
ncbi:MAG: hypothetical protein CM1200mP30_20050 [Pseudomonadota bacterium]|nr:MAG: hypothetical protein CM1200mP30_20050 [Pseudomonadota bacterium]